jgi:hypothetical protein
MKTMHDQIISFRKMVLATVFCATAILGWTAQSQAAIISFDINGFSPGDTPSLTYSGAASIGEAGDFWNAVTVTNNTVASFTATSLKLVDGVTVTPVSFSVSVGTGNLGGDNINGALGSSNDLLNDYIYTVANPVTFTLSGLVANSTYDLYLYGNAGGGAHGKFTIGGISKTSDTGWAPVPPGAFFAPAWPSTAAFTNIQSDGSGVITGTLYNDGAATAFNGFQISGAVPEPSTWALLAIGLTVVVVLHRRRSRA